MASGARLRRTRRCQRRSFGGTGLERLRVHKALPRTKGDCSQSLGVDPLGVLAHRSRLLDRNLQVELASALHTYYLPRRHIAFVHSVRLGVHRLQGQLAPRDFVPCLVQRDFHFPQCHLDSWKAGCSTTAMGRRILRPHFASHWTRSAVIACA